MPPKAKVTKENIVAAALCIVRKEGYSALNARAVAEKLGISTQPIFSNYESMETLKADVISSANDIYNDFISREIESGKYPPYKSSGIAYIRFAKEEKELFKLLFMRDRSNETITEDHDEVKPLISLIMKNTGLDEKEAYMFHMEMWIYVHGIATMIATDYLKWDWSLIDRMLTDSYLGMKKHYLSGEEE